MLISREINGAKTISVYDSSNILSSIYDDDDNYLVIKFKSGTLYRYNNVTKADFMRFEFSDSQGQAFNSYIKKYNFEKLDKNEIDLVLNEIDVDRIKKEQKKLLLNGKKNDIIDKLILLLDINDKTISKVYDDNNGEKMFLDEIEKLKDAIINFLNYNKTDI